jgi:GH15 family glucan-1,4-alpha-glucosidase
MTSSIADYALIGDCETAALVARNGSIDWLCLPRFDSPACFAALLGTWANGRWIIAPSGRAHIKRRYRPHSLILETTFSTREGQVTLIDFMPLRERNPNVIRVVRGDRGSLQMRMNLVLRFGYGQRSPTISETEGAVVARSGSDRVILRSSAPVSREGADVVGAFSVKAGEAITFELSSVGSIKAHEQNSSPISALAKTQAWWNAWASHLKYHGPHAAAVERSLITLKALTYAPTGGIVAAPTTSLPEAPRGRRNWDYRYCWLRDATFTLLGFIHAGFHDEAQAWKEWLLHAAGANPNKLKIMYDVTGRTVNREWKAAWLKGYCKALPVRIGNAAAQQLQLDVFGELSDALFQAGISRRKSIPAFRLLVKLLNHLEKIWRRPDHGIWEMRDGTRQFTHSKVMCWVAFDRAIRAAEEIGAEAHLARWRGLRQEIHEDVCRSGFNPRLGSFVRSYGSQKVDANLLLLPLVGFLPPGDQRIIGTMRLIEKKLMRQGFLMRREQEKGRPREGAFLPCSLWLADCHQLAGRHAAATRLLRRLLNIRNDVGLLAEEYDPATNRFAGNFPQALSHVALVNTIINLHTKTGPSRQRSSAGRREWLL